MNEWMNEWMNQSINQSINRSINQSVNQSIKNRSISQSINFKPRKYRWRHISVCIQNSCVCLSFCLSVSLSVRQSPPNEMAETARLHISELGSPEDGHRYISKCPKIINPNPPPRDRACKRDTARNISSLARSRGEDGCHSFDSAGFPRRSAAKTLVGNNRYFDTDDIDIDIFDTVYVTSQFAQ